MPFVALLLLIWALFGCAVVVMMIYGAFEHVAKNDAVMAVVLATGTAFLASVASFLSWWRSRRWAGDQRSRTRTPPPALLLSVLLAGMALPARAGDAARGWPVYGGSPGGGHFTLLTQITAANVSQLREAWTYHTGDYSPGAPAIALPLLKQRRSWRTTRTIFARPSTE